MLNSQEADVGRVVTSRSSHKNYIKVTIPSQVEVLNRHFSRQILLNTGTAQLFLLQLESLNGSGPHTSCVVGGDAERESKSSCFADSKSSFDFAVKFIWQC